MIESTVVTGLDCHRTNVSYVSIGSYSHTQQRMKEKNMDDVFAFFSHYSTI